MGPAATQDAPAVDEVEVGEGDVGDVAQVIEDGGDVASETPAVDAKNTRPYKVLRFDEPEDVDPSEVIDLSIVGEFVAHGDKQAVSLAGDKYGPGRYVAVAASHWHERTASEKPQPTVLVVE